VSAPGGVILAFDPQIQLYTPLVQGFFQGAVYGLIGLGIVLLYKSNGIFNFAQAEFGTVAALVTYAGLNGSFFGWHLNYGVACLLGVVAGTLSAVLTERLVVRPLFHRPKVILLVGTVGVLLLMVAIEGLMFQELRNLPAFNAKSHGTFKDPAITLGFASYRVSWQELLILLVLLILALGSVAFFRYSQTGTAILAVSQEPTAAAVVGISVSRVSLITWTIAGFLGSVGGLLLSPGGGLIGPGTVTATALIAGFTAAVLGGITSLPGAFVGGVIIGILQRLAGATITQFPGSEEVTVGLVLLVVLLIRPRGLLGKEA
jgi:branched-chain amino acid transport system permease protein